MNLRPWLVVSSVLFFTGCPSDAPIDSETGGSEEDSGSDTGEPLTEVPLADFFTLAEEAHCAWQTRCNGYGAEGRCREVVHMDTLLSMQALAGVGSSNAVTPEYMAQAVEVGRIEYDEEAAADCLTYVANLSCEWSLYHAYTEEELAGRAACEAVFRGRMGKNGPCAEAIECAEEAICGFDPTCTDMCCVGACRVLPQPYKIGEPCPNFNIPCEAGSSCTFDIDTGMPSCVALAEIGESCESVQCVETAMCDYVDSYKCVERKGAGKPCDGDYECQPGLVCAYDLNFNAGECVAPADEGEPCKVSYQTTCRRFDNYCAGGTCAPLPGNGEACAMDDECRGDLFCAESAGNKCSPLADLGEVCGWNGSEEIPCSGDQYCDYGDGEGQPTCKAPAVDLCPVPADPLEG